MIRVTEHEQTVLATAPPPEISPKRRLPFTGDPLSQLAGALLIVLVLTALAGRWLPLGDPSLINAGPRMAPPSWQFWAGTDSLGRSVLPRLVQGLRATLLVAGVSVLLTIVVSTILGMVAAYAGGATSEIIVRLADVLFSFPAILLALLIVAVVGPGVTSAAVSIALICSPLMIRVVRASGLSVVTRDYITAARVGGASNVRVLFVHVLPGVAGAAVVQGTYALSLGMLVESGLSFLGLGLQPPLASLGSLVNDGSIYLPVAPWLVIIPGALLALTILTVNLCGDGLRDSLEVRRVEVRR